VRVLRRENELLTSGNIYCTEAFGLYYLYFTTCLLRFSSKSPCRSDVNNELWVIVSVAKGGTVLAARASIEIANACNLCIGIGYRPFGGWPPAREYNPTNRVDVLMAIANAQSWPEYAEQHGGRVRCAVITRSPWTRFKSMYQYFYDGSEYELQDISRVLKQFHAQNISKVVEYMFTTVGNATMLDSHEHLKLSLKREDCIPIRFEDFDIDFDRTVRKWIDIWGITDPVAQEKVIIAARRHNLKRKSKDELAKEHHVSGRVFSERDAKEIEKAIRENHAISHLLESQSKELGYCN